MTRTITINYARLLGTPSASFDPAARSGMISVNYTVGTYTPANPSATPPTPERYQEMTAAVLVGSASVTLSATDAAMSRLAALVSTIATQEQLQLAPTGTDRVVSSAGEQLG